MHSADTRVCRFVWNCLEIIVDAARSKLSAQRLRPSPLTRSHDHTLFLFFTFFLLLGHLTFHIYRFYVTFPVAYTTPRYGPLSPYFIWYVLWSFYDVSISLFLCLFSSSLPSASGPYFQMFPTTAHSTGTDIHITHYVAEALVLCA